VRARPFGNALRLVAAARAREKAFLPRQRVQHVGGGVRIVAGGDEVGQAAVVGFIFLHAGIAQREVAGGLARDPRQPVGLREHAHREDAEAAQDGALLLPLAMVADDVPDLVREHGGELVLAVDDRHEAPRHVDEAAGDREGVDDVAVDQRERALAGEARGARELLAQAAT
jgi:hypothetical protein